ncbi:putative Zn-finger in Ran binding protein and others domain containing protein [Monocercomonoides exilis]|uniref:putative Zn-finger in Ran binding protein and others domain containing protein n=1 Tax=Monocercomonoides exilis TaxID=2049356 RepID=UPI00355A8A57|nr:putative Zn-finger in Ran binding protein and others domain containing protein [Monocercomonoides exilis]|eukprot:MONOS_15690.1-p1 / transcript=MONOS_15690.1 / gene=MONOS_15690 / organism=Monocercomonoides_exilis_PA203 / gene_product=Zn-finger in Ran binding protein and others domain containing protein / transcript_product=Zn-finger in Ran binding protein and others domain containing protein / location=Mono_scaffold01312:9975-10884(+) / protein_length=180 / sequence_SO=supercontig / SO=protein_coding / is_pseudo=false
MDQLRAGDWICPQCSGHNYSKRMACFRCSQPKPMFIPRGMALVTKPFTPVSPSPSSSLTGHWVCEQCRALNPPTISDCLTCGDSRWATNRTKTMKSAKPLREGDWYCSKCGYLNYSFRSTCQKCDSPEKFASTVIGDTFQSKMKDGRVKESRPGDWKCPNCNAYNYAFRTSCFRCQFEKL